MVSPSAIGMPDGYPATTEVTVLLEDVGGRTHALLCHHHIDHQDVTKDTEHENKHVEYRHCDVDVGHGRPLGGQDGDVVKVVGGCVYCVVHGGCLKLSHIQNDG